MFMTASRCLEQHVHAAQTAGSTHAFCGRRLHDKTCCPCGVHAIHFPADQQRGALPIHDGVDVIVIDAACSLLHRGRLTGVLSSTSPEATPEDEHGSESVGCDSLDWPQPPGPSSHHRAGNATPIPRAAPYLSFGQQPRDLGNASTAWRLLWARATTPSSMSGSRQDTRTWNRRNFDGSNTTMPLQ